MSKESVIKTAISQLGYTESPPGSNRVKYWDEYGLTWQGQPWCVCFLWWCFMKADESMAFFAGAKTSSCGVLWRWYKEQGQTVPVDEVQPADLVFYNFHGGTQPEHVGLAESVTPRPISQVTSLEGNTSPGLEGSQDNGGCVARKIRYRSQIVGVARPKYKEEVKPVLTDDDYSTHWAVKDIDLAIERGLMKGYPDGTFKPDKPITRAELAVVLNRIYDLWEVKNG